MNNTPGTLLQCPNCFQKEFNQFGNYRSFGSITPQGEVIIMRKGGHRTMIIAKEFLLACDCGYHIYFKQGQISMGEIPASYPYEENHNYQ
jgi:hypothetical protein